MEKLVFFTGLITGLVVTFWARWWFRSVQASLWILIGAIVGSVVIYIALYSDKKILNATTNAIQLFLWKPIFGLPNGTVADIVPLFLTILLLQIVGSILGSFLGLSLWWKFFRS
jgi:MFS superfamily sulfate permease-like transporter